MGPKGPRGGGSRLQSWPQPTNQPPCASSILTSSRLWDKSRPWPGESMARRCNRRQKKRTPSNNCRAPLRPPADLRGQTRVVIPGDPTVRGAPQGHTLVVREVRLAAGARFVVMVCGEMMTMPGLPARRPRTSSASQTRADHRLVVSRAAEAFGWRSTDRHPISHPPRRFIQRFAPDPLQAQLARPRQHQAAASAEIA